MIHSDDRYAIDFVVLWVDSNDEEWQEQRDYYSKLVRPNEYCGGEQRFRDWNLFKYWFRGVEKYAPWVRTVHLVTCGQIPDWINHKYPKLHIVSHNEILPAHFLPTFNSNAIEICINKISGLSDHFVYFNDDIYMMAPMRKELFFRNGIPCSTAGFNIFMDIEEDFAGILHRSTRLLNDSFNSWTVIKKHWLKFIHPCYGLRKNVKTTLLLPWCRYWFPGFAYEHGPNAFLKSTLESVWKEEKGVLTETCSHRFRQYNDVNQYIFKWWQWCEGNFHPIDERKIYSIVTVAQDTGMICKMIESPRQPVLVVNDASIENFEEKKKMIQKAFEKRFPEKCSFEK